MVFRMHWQSSCSATTWLAAVEAHPDREASPGTLTMKILLVEDHAESRASLQRLLERRGHDVVAVASAEEAKRAMAGDSFPFLILDWMLPGQSGVELCRELRARVNGDEVFILLVTAKADTSDLELALAA